jgi:uncharacterized protein with GYD domain
MATYILLGTFTDEGAEKIRSHPEWIDQVNQDLSKMGVTVIAQYAVLGPYDLVNIIEAPDNRSVVRVSADLSLRGSVRITSMPALPIEEFLATLK